MKNAYVIVDAYNSGRQLADAFIEKIKDDPNTVLIHIQSTLTPYAAGTPPETAKFAENIVNRGNIDEVLEGLKKYKVLAVLPGSEPGIELADTLSEKLRLKTSNGTALSSARRNKYEMRRAVSEAKLQVPAFLKSKDLPEILKWVETHSQYPVVLKALRSAGTDGVYISRNEKELRDAFNKLHGSESIFRETNDEVLVESFLDGNEYIVDSVSLSGKHYVTDVWMYQKKFIPGHGNIYDRVLLLPVEAPKVKELIDYNAKMLDALGINNGPSHAEIIYTSKGPALVEVGARISGAAQRTFDSLCLGHNQIDLTAESYINPERFMKKIGQSYEMKQSAMIVVMSYEGISGTIERIDQEVLRQMKALPSVKLFFLSPTEGAALSPTRTLMNAPARIFMAHESEQQLHDDYAAIEKLKTRLFRIIPKVSGRFKPDVDSTHKLSLIISQNKSLLAQNTSQLRRSKL